MSERVWVIWEEKDGPEGDTLWAVTRDEAAAHAVVAELNAVAHDGHVAGCMPLILDNLSEPKEYAAMQRKLLIVRAEQSMTS